MAYKYSRDTPLWLVAEFVLSIMKHCLTNAEVEDNSN